METKVKTRQEITEAHINALTSGDFPIMPKDGERKFRNAGEVKTALLSGEVIPALSRNALFRLPVSMQLGASVGIFTPGSEKQLRKLINNALIQLGI